MGGRPGDRPSDRHRNESACESLLGPCVEGHRFPIAKIAANSIGYTLDEIPNDITEKTPASFEPSIDYVVTKIPRWAFEKFPGTSGVLSTSMQSVGEVMAIGRPSPSRCKRRSVRSSRAAMVSTPTLARRRSTTSRPKNS